MPAEVVDVVKVLQYNLKNIYLKSVAEFFSNAFLLLIYYLFQFCAGNYYFPLTDYYWWYNP